MFFSNKHQAILCGLRLLLGSVLYERLIMRRRHGYWPHLRHPRSVNERLAHIKLFAGPPMAPQLADKYRAREYVKAKGLENILNKIYFVGDDPDRIPFDTLPQKYVIRFTHNSGGVILVQDNAQIDRAEIRKKCAAQLAFRFGYFTDENWYLKIPPRLVVEEMLTDKEFGIPPDYKFYVIKGKIGFINVTTSHLENRQLRFYTPDWKPYNFEWGYPLGPDAAPPRNLEEMKTIALKLAEGFEFIRIDLYSVDGKDTRFGEITFSDGAAWDPFTPRSMDFELGRLWEN